jgi:hypothetical protein
MVGGWVGGCVVEREDGADSQGRQRYCRVYRPSTGSVVLLMLMSEVQAMYRGGRRRRRGRSSTTTSHRLTDSQCPTHHDPSRQHFRTMDGHASRHSNSARQPIRSESTHVQTAVLQSCSHHDQLSPHTTTTATTRTTKFGSSTWLPHSRGKEKKRC